MNGFEGLHSAASTEVESRTTGPAAAAGRTPTIAREILTRDASNGESLARETRAREIAARGQPRLASLPSGTPAHQKHAGTTERSSPDPMLPTDRYRLVMPYLEQL